MMSSSTSRAKIAFALRLVGIEIGDPELVRDVRVAGAAVAAAVERQEPGLAVQQRVVMETLSSSSAKWTSAPRLKVSSGSPAGDAVIAVLPFGVLEGLSR